MMSLVFMPIIYQHFTPERQEKLCLLLIYRWLHKAYSTMKSAFPRFCVKCVLNLMKFDLRVNGVEWVENADRLPGWYFCVFKRFDAGQNCITIEVFMQNQLSLLVQEPGCQFIQC